MTAGTPDAASVVTTPDGWDALLDLVHGREAVSAGRVDLASAAVIASDGRTLSPGAVSLLEGARTAERSLCARTVTASVAADLTLLVGTQHTTVAEQVGGQVAVSACPTSLAPVRLAEQLGLGPRDLRVGLAPVTAPARLWEFLTDPSSMSVDAFVTDLVTAFALDAPEAADAVEHDRWRVSLTTAWGSEGTQVGSTVVLVDTSGGLFGLTASGEGNTLVALTTTDAWRALGPLVPPAA